MRICVHAYNDNPGSPVLVFGNALGTRLPLWSAVASRLADDFQIYLTDLPGHTFPASAAGTSTTPAAAAAATEAGAAFTISDLAAGLVESLAERGVEKFAYAGVSISGAIGLTLALEHSESLTGLIACASSTKFGTAQTWAERIEDVRADGTRSLVDDTADRWFAAGFLAEDIASGHFLLTDLAAVDDEAYIACAQALQSYDLSGGVHGITVPTLFLAGAQDPTCTPEAMTELAGQVDESRLAVIPDAAHLPMAEHPEIVFDHIHDFLGAL